MESEFSIMLLGCFCYLNDFLGHRWVEPLESFPVSDEQLKHIAGCLGHHFVPKLNKQTNKDHEKGKK